MIDNINLQFFAQTTNESSLTFVESFSSGLGEDLVGSLLTLAKALLILIIGLIFANWFKGFIRKQLKRTDIDNKIANWITGSPDTQDFPVEDWIAEAAAWLITLFVVVGFLNALDLNVVSEPLNALLNEITKFLPRIGGAALLLAVAWLIATIIKLLVTRAFTSFQIDEKLNQQVDESESPESRISLSQTIGNTLYWFVFLLFLPSILDALELQGTLRPLEELVNKILGIIPNIFAAVILAAVGWLIAKIVKKVVKNLLTAAGVNRIGEKFGLSASPRQASLADIIGSVVYVLVLIPIAITALDALQIEAISEPATDMLNQVLDLLPKLFAATVILGFAYVGGQYISELVTNVLASIGFNNIFDWLGISQDPARPSSVKTTPPPPPPSSLEDISPSDDLGLDPPSGSTYSSGTTSTSATSTTTRKSRTPSELVGVVVLVAIMLVASLTAVDILRIEALETVVATILVLAGQVLVGIIIFAIGLYFANLAFNLISTSGTRQSRFLAQTARIAIIVLVSAMTLERIGIAPDIVNLAFGLLTGGIAVAIALAFGLGGRETAGRAVQEWFDSFKNKEEL